ncbi:glycoside hydrolase [Shewanella psychropiezotolerans]|uniref:Glycoside hydrolase n=1 Tax=Shewanella psychropiezotolerans TaxID=2593655 RepID=A0ABX5WXI9_9GAMM|nr:glycosyl hydrolase family 18 protein [Shewanella psychropiezotolerans]QDO83817.1 glycoside hydrolase [Shewanella psychropiezotolerans]
MSNKTAYLGRRHRLALLISTSLLSQAVVSQAYAVDCQGVAPWLADTVYASTTQVTEQNTLFQNKWWTTNESPADAGEWGVWETLGQCDGASNQAPVVNILAPQAGSTVNLNDSMVLNAEATDSDGTVDSLMWTANDIPVTSPWLAHLQGAVVLKVTATDNDGASTEQLVNITVVNNQNLSPETAIISPINDSAVTSGDSILITANASDPDVGDSIAKVELLVDGVVVSTDTSDPYEFSWIASYAGDHSLQSRAFDSQNDSAVSASVNINVTAANQLPSVELTSPSANFNLVVNGELSIGANALDSDGDIVSVSFFANGVLIETDTLAPYSTLYSTAQVGDLSITAEVTDNLGASALSSAILGYVGDRPTSHEACRPDGLEGDSVYCDIYDENGREKMGADHARRVIGYFTSWRNGTNGQPSYLVNDIPWDKITHINYAFAHIDGNNKVSVGDPNSLENPATSMTWAGVVGAEMDPEYSYKGHFNLLNKYKKLHPQVKTLISIGGWAETGGYFDDTGNRIASGGFYEMTKTQAGINTFADSVVEFLQTYGFDGADIDYEYATSMAKSGNPDDFAVADPLRATLFAQYDTLMKTLREKLDTAGKQDNKHYMLTVAAPASGYLLRGMEAYQMTRFLDYVNIMSYDLHGAWNDFVGHNAALYDTGEDAELAFWDVYSTAQYGGIGYLNTDWAYHYFRGAMPAGRINIGLPYYTRGWQGVTGGLNGLWGKAALPDQASCPSGTGEGDNNCGYGAQGIDNLWHDLDKNGNEMFAGSNPMWHAKNLEQGITGSYLASYGLDPINDPADELTGTYERHYDNVAQSSWLWNPSKQVYLSTEDEQAMNTKVQYVVDKGIGGVMFWELAGDFDWYPERNSGQGEYFIGETMTTIAYDKFASATPYGNTVSNSPALANALALSANLSGYKVGDSNYPITPTLTISNNSQSTIPGGAVFEFDISTSTSSQISDQSGMNLAVVTDGSNAASGNVGGLENDFHRVRFTLPSYKSIAPGADFGGTIKYYLPVSMPSNFTVSFDGVTYDFGQAGSTVPGECELDPTAPGCGDTTPPISDSCRDANIEPSVIPAYPNFPQTDWAGNPSHATGGDRMKDETAVFVALWWTNAKPSASSGDWDFVCNLN